jgi:hypothetical protein
VSDKFTKITDIYWPDGTGLPEAPTLTARDTTLLECGGDSIELKNPPFGDNLDVVTPKIVRETRGGSLRTLTDDSWGSRFKLEFEFHNLNRDEFLNLQEFVKTTIGKLITLTDCYSRTWAGIITNPDALFTDNGRDSSESDTPMDRSVKIEFEGSLS